MSDERDARTLPLFPSSVAASPAKTSPVLDAAPGSTASGPGSGANTRASSRSSGRDASSLKTCLRLLQTGWTSLSVTSSGAVTASLVDFCERPTSEPHTVESGSSSSLWPTPLVVLATGGMRHGVRPAKEGQRLDEAVRALWPTATASDARGSRRSSARAEDWESHSGETLLDAVIDSAKCWPTITAERYGTRNNGSPHDGRTEYATRGAPSLETMASLAGGFLNPAWVETLMGFPIGWSDGPADGGTLPLFGSPRE